MQAVHCQVLMTQNLFGLCFESMCIFARIPREIWADIMQFLSGMNVGNILNVLLDNKATSFLCELVTAMVAEIRLYFLCKYMWNFMNAFNTSKW